MNNWEKRELKVGEDLPEKGEISDYIEDTPEKSLIEFLYFFGKEELWKYGKVGF
ncbi:hypothetical protein P9386_07835 [Caldifermentibacillus hisashii]|uniref:hypothetical protein n=1 Tax=Caldifermentibacillus hisashii TaxID=996558 RepID=UPI002E1FC810|nr:hypothetical protein [Caldifermentibacillus hisashii]